MFLRHMSPQTYAQIPKYSCLLGLRDLSRTFKVSKGPSLENLKTKSQLRAWTFCAYPSHPHSSHHRNFDPGICEVVGRAKYGSFLSSGNFRGIFSPSNPFNIQLHASHQFQIFFHYPPLFQIQVLNPHQVQTTKIHLHRGLYSPIQRPYIVGQSNGRSQPISNSCQL